MPPIHARDTNHLKLGKAWATDKPSDNLSESGYSAWGNIAELEGPKGIKGFRSTNNGRGSGTEQLQDPKWKAPAKARLNFKFYCTEPQTVIDYVVPMVRQLRAANPDIEISMQIRTEGEVSDLIALTDLLKDELDGLSILTSLETTATATELMMTLRPPAVDELTEAEVAQLAAERQALEAEGLAAAASDSNIVIQPIPTSVAVEPEAAAEQGVDSAESTPTSTNDANLLAESGNSTWILAIVGVLVVAAIAAAFMALRTDTPTQPKGRI